MDSDELNPFVPNLDMGSDAEHGPYSVSDEISASEWDGYFRGDFNHGGLNSLTFGENAAMWNVNLQGKESLSPYLGQQQAPEEGFTGLVNQLPLPTNSPIPLATPGQDTSSSTIQPLQCDWPDCQFKTSSKRPGQLRQHICNIHDKPLLCNWEGCRHKRPFERRSDLGRHIKTKHHGARDHTCPVEDCIAHETRFPREDSLRAHMRNRHPELVLRCQETHCRATLLDGGQQSHVESSHGDFECALGSCQMAAPSRFTKQNLRRHLRSHHRVTSHPCDTTIHRLEASEDTTLSTSHIGRCRPHDCSMCGPQARTGP